MIGYWISFGLLFPIILFGIAALKVWTKNNSRIEITPEMDKAANKRMIRYIFFYWLCNLFYMACFIKNDVCKYIFGGLILLIVFMNLVSTFTYPKERSQFEKWGMLQDFLVGVGLSVYLIYIIPSDSVKQVVIPIVAAIYGGLLTLTGVAWTIRQGQKERAEDRKQLEEDRKQEEIKRAKPLFSFLMLFGDDIDLSGEKACVTQDDQGSFDCNSIIENSNQSVFSMKRVFHDGKWYHLVGNYVCLPNSKTHLGFKLNQPFDRSVDIILEIEDALGNQYYYSVLPLISPTSIKGTVFANKSSTNKKMPEFRIREIKEVSLEELKKRNIPLEETP